MHMKPMVMKIKSIAAFFLLGMFLMGCDPRRIPEASLTSDSEVRIHDIQGCSHQSPFAGSNINDLPGIVTRKVSNGFYMQDDQFDAYFCTSEAIFVFTNTFPEVLPGDRVNVTGRVEEYQPGGIDSQNLATTQIFSKDIKILSHGNPLPEKTLIGTGGISIPGMVIDDDTLKVFDPENDGIDFYESLESMLVRIENGVVVGARNQYNEVVIIPGESLSPNLVSKEGGLLLQENDLNPERIILNLNKENQEKIHVGASLDKPIIGIVDYAYGNYKVNVFGVASFHNTAFNVSELEKMDGALSVASYNVENLSRFDQARLAKLAEDVGIILDSPDILILHEILDDSGVEDDGETSAALTLKQLVSQIEENGGISYDYIDNPPLNNQDGGIEGGNIRSVILYRPDRINIAESTVGGLATNPTRIGSENWPFSGTRKPLVALFEHEGAQFLIVALHLTSRGADSPLYGNIQPVERPEESKRIAQAGYIYEFIRDFQKRNPEVMIILAGDLNDDPWSKTLQTIKGDLLADSRESLPENERFTYILDGNAIQLDHILYSTNTEWTGSVSIIHLNTLFDHTLQISDHDPVIAEFYIP